jgi:hypothetical protein
MVETTFMGDSMMYDEVCDICVMVPLYEVCDGSVCWRGTIEKDTIGADRRNDEKPNLSTFLDNANQMFTGGDS